MDRRLIPILFITFVNSLGYSIVIPVAPFIVEELGGGAVAFGIVLSAYALCQYLASPFLGSLSDKYGRKPLLIISHLGTMLSWLIFIAALHTPDYRIIGIHSGLIVLLISRMFDGLTGGNVSVAGAYVSDITPHNKLSKVYGFISAAYGIGYMVGPIIGARSISLGYRYEGVGILAIILSIITLVTLVFLLPESIHEKSKLSNISTILRDDIRKAKYYLYAAVRYGDNKKVQELLYERTIFAFIFALYLPIIGLYLKDYFNMSVNGIGWMFLIIALFLVINQGLIVPLLSTKISDDNLLKIAIYLMIVFSIIVPFAEDTVLFLIVSYFIILSFSINFSVLKAVLLKLSPREKRGEISGIEDSMFSITQAIVPAGAALVYTQFGGHIFMSASIPLVIFLIYKSRNNTQKLS